MTPSSAELFADVQVRRRVSPPSPYETVTSASPPPVMTTRMGRYNQFTASPGVSPDYYVSPGLGSRPMSVQSQPIPMSVQSPPIPMSVQSQPIPMSVQSQPRPMSILSPPIPMSSPPRPVTIHSPLAPVVMTSPLAPVVMASPLRPMTVASPQRVPIKEVRPSYIGPVCSSPILPDATNLHIPPDYQNLADTMANRSQPARTRERAQVELEEKLVSQASCSGLNPSIVDALRTHIYDIDARFLDEVFAGPSTLNSAVHSDLACIVSAIVHPETLGMGAPLSRERIRQWFVSLRQIGNPSVEGYAMATSFSPDTKLFVMKSPRNPGGDQLVHEAAIGILALNKLRAWVPNFMYVYGYAQCSPPVLENKEPVTWCSSDEPEVSYLISENIRDAVTINEFVSQPQVTPKDLWAVYLQVFNALNVANKTYGYTHYDLHGGNIMVRDFKTPIAVPYYGANSMGNGPIGYIVSQYVPYIIDYGFNRIQIKEVSLGKMGLESVGIHPDQFFPMYDVYKNILFVAENLLRAYETVGSSEFLAMEDKMSVLEMLVSFFGDEPIHERVQRRLNNIRDYYNVGGEYRFVTMDQYLNWLHGGDIEFPLFTKSQAQSMGAIIPDLNAPVDICRFYESIDGHTPPANALEYCETVNAIRTATTLSAADKQGALDSINSRFDAEQHYLDTAPALALSVNEFFDVVDNNHVSPTDNNIVMLLKAHNADIEDFEDSDFTNNYRLRLLLVLSLKEISALNAATIRSYRCALAEQGVLDRYVDELDASENLIMEAKQFLDIQRQILNQNIEYLADVTSDDMEEFWGDEHDNLVAAL